MTTSTAPEPPTDSDRGNTTVPTPQQDHTRTPPPSPTLGADTRARYQIKDTVKSGVVITRVDPMSNAAEKRLQPGEIIVEINQKAVSTPSDVQDALKGLKKDGKKSALLLVANAAGEVRFVPVTID